MAVWDQQIVWGFVFLLAGAAGQSVNYRDPVCAVKGSTVTLPCTFTALKTVNQGGRDVPIQVIRVRWCQNHPICQGTTPSVYDSASTNNSPRYKYLGDLKGNCTLQITDIQQEDNTTIRFRMEVNNTLGGFTEQSGVNITVTDGDRMKIKSSSGDGAVRRGEAVTLHCTAACTFHPLEVTWSRDGHALSVSGPALQLGPLTAEDSGSYTCGLKTNVGTVSPPYSLRVEEEQAANVSLAVGVAFGVLLALLTLIMVLCIIKRKRAADKDQKEGGRQETRGQETRGQETRGQETSPAAEDVSYASVLFKHNSQARPADEAEDGIIYSTLASQG